MSVRTVVRAVLSAGNVDTAYQRGGAGPLTLLVAHDAVRDELRASLFDALTAHCRVIMPVSCTLEREGTITFSGWLHDFLEGVGAATIFLVVADPACQEAIEFVQEHPSQVARLALLSDGANLSVHAECPTCVLHLSSPSLIADTVRFLLPDCNSNPASPT